MVKKILFVSLILVLFACNKTEKQSTKIPEKEISKNGVQLRFLDEYVYPAKQEFKSTIIGGLSGIDYTNNQYYIVADDAKKPRAYKAKIEITGSSISEVQFTDVISFDKKKHSFFADNNLDLESIVIENNKLIITSEGKVTQGKNPLIFQTDTLGNFESAFQLPSKFLANSTEKPRNNGVFEGLTRSYNKKGYWSAIEFPLESDGEEPKFPTTNSPVRFTYYDAETKKATKEFTYELSPLSRENKGFVNLNGLTDILEYKKNHFFVIERTYQSGYKGDENLVKIYEAIIDSTTTNTLETSSLKKVKYTSMRKRLIFDFSNVKSKLTSQTIDNIEGITFGPKLSNGNRSLILVSDDNFQSFGKQLNQFILLEVIE